MKIAKHFPFYITDVTITRVKWINNSIKEINTGKFETDIFIHTNKIFSKDLLDKNKKGIIEIIVHDLTNISNHYHLTWKCRDLLKKQKNNYDIFMHHEDDMLIPNEAIEYWLKYKDLVMKENYNLGFIRIEVDYNGEEYTTDNSTMPGEYSDYLKNGIKLNEIEYIINDINPYCCFWIYDKNEFAKFVDSHLYNINNIRGYGVPESSSVGLHGKWTDWYKGTIIPIINNKLIKSCRIYHQPNNFVNGTCKKSKQYHERGWYLHKFNELLDYYNGTK